MPKRQNTHRVVTAELQGEDSYVVVRLPSVGEVRGFTQEQRDSLRRLEASTEFLAQYVVEWNWVDDDGNPLPQPKDDPSVIEQLTTAEFKRLSEIVLGSEEKRKN